MHTKEPIHYIIAPGFQNSGTEHWQTRWEQHLPNTRRTQPSSWTNPEHDDWVNALEREIRAAEGPVILIAHSLGTITVAEWATRHPSDKVLGALLVAIPDVQRPDLPEAIQGFSNPRLEPLPFPSIAVLSSDDPFSALPRGRLYAQRFGSRIEEIGNAGHINHDSGLGDWEAGYQWLDQLVHASSQSSRWKKAG